MAMSETWNTPPWVIAGEPFPNVKWYYRYNAYQRAINRAREQGM